MTSLDALKRAILRGAPEDQQADPLWTQDDSMRPWETGVPETSGLVTVAGATLDPTSRSQRLKETYTRRSEARKWADFQRDPFTPGRTPIGVNQDWGAFNEALRHNQASLGTTPRTVFSGAPPGSVSNFPVPLTAEQQLTRKKR